MPGEVGPQLTRRDGPLQGEASGLAKLLRQQHAAQNTREFVRGSLGSIPFAPGASSRGCLSWLQQRTPTWL